VDSFRGEVDDCEGFLPEILRHHQLERIVIAGSSPVDPAIFSSEALRPAGPSARSLGIAASPALTLRAT
jgi:hypothetical protein